MLNTITLGDARKLALEIPDESVDMVLTDPPYHKKDLPLYKFIAEQSVRILKPGSWAFIYGGWVGKEVMDLLDRPEWDHFMTIALVNKGGYPRWWTKKLMIGFKPVWVYVKGWPPKIFKWQSNLSNSDMSDKRYHVWGQGTGFAIEKIDMFTEPGDIIVDFFAGGGQVPEAAIVTGRQFIAFEKVKETWEIAMQRIKDISIPMFEPDYRQKELWEN